MDLILHSQANQNYENLTGVFQYDNTVANFTYPTDIFKISIVKIGIPLPSEISFQENKFNKINDIKYTIGLPIYYIYINPTTRFNSIIEKLYLNKEYKQKTIQFQLYRPYTTPQQTIELQEMDFNIFHITKSTFNNTEIGYYGYLIIGMPQTLINLLTTTSNKYNKKQENLSFSEFLKWIINEPISVYVDTQTPFYNLTIPNNETYLSYLQTFFQYYNDYLFMYDEINKKYVLDKLPFKTNNYTSYGKIFNNRTTPDYIAKQNISVHSAQIINKKLFIIAHTYYTHQIKDNYTINYITFLTPHTFNIGEIILEAQNSEPNAVPHLIVGIISNYTHFITDEGKYLPIKLTKLFTITQN